MTKQYNESVSDDELRKLPLLQFDGRVTLVDNMQKFRKVMGEMGKPAVLGFDTETRPSFRKGRKNKVSLIQLANENLACLIRINKIGIPSELAGLLANHEVIKAGVAVHDDIRFLKRVKGFSPEGFIDLQQFVREFGIQCSGLKKLSAIVLGFRISKRQQVTDWEAEHLSEAQQIYAATDAWVCYQIYRKLINGNENSTQIG